MAFPYDFGFVPSTRAEEGGVYTQARKSSVKPLERVDSVED